MNHDSEVAPPSGKGALVLDEESVIQPYNSLRPVPTALTTEARASNAQLLNQILADSMVLFTLYKKHHWFMRGHTFYQLHLLFDRHAEEQLALIDKMAERVQSLGAVAISDPWHVAEVAKLERPPRGVEEVTAMLSRLVQAHVLLMEESREAIATTATNMDWTTNDLLVGDVLRINEKQVWILAEHLMNGGPDFEGFRSG